MQTWVREINLELDLIEKDESQIAELAARPRII